MIQLAIYAILIGIVAAGAFAVHHSIILKGEAITCTRIAPDDDCIKQPELTALVKERDDARGAERQREGELKTLQLACSNQSKAVDAMAAIGSKIHGDVASLVASGKQHNANTDAKIAEWAAVVPKGDKSAQCDHVDSIISDALRIMRN